jgi:hypothetical protein
VYRWIANKYVCVYVRCVCFYVFIAAGACLKAGRPVLDVIAAYEVQFMCVHMYVYVYSKYIGMCVYVHAHKLCVYMC